MSRLLCLSFVLFCFANSAQAAEPATTSEKGYAHDLFDGESLFGWTVTGCDTVVQDGAMLLKGGDGFVRSNAEYGDFVLELEWKALKEAKWDSGIYIRAAAPAAGSPWPKRYQINLLQGHEGRLLGFKHPDGSSLCRAGEWNKFKITVVGDTAKMEINGEPAWEVKGLEASRGFIGFQSEVDGGGQFLFRNIKIQELGHKSLLEGDTITAWEGATADASQCWSIKNGVLTGEETKGPWLRSKEQYGDFNLRLEYKVGAGMNSGVFIRVPENGNHHGAGAGIEVQLLDDAAPKYAKLKAYQYTGSLYAIAPADPRVGRGADLWNTLEIDCKGEHYKIIHNGVTIINAGPDDYPELKERNGSGFLGLQNHGGGVAIRRIRIGGSVQ